ALGARSMNAVDVFGGDWDVDDAAEAFAGLCDRAGEHGLVVHLEFLPWSKIPDVGSAWEVVRLAGRSNGGIAIDAWHFFRGGPHPPTPPARRPTPPVASSAGKAPRQTLADVNSPGGLALGRCLELRPAVLH